MMTTAQAIAAIRATGANLTAEDINNLKGATDAQLEYIVQSWIDAGKVRGKDVAQDIIAVLKQVPDWVTVAVQIVKVVGGIFAA
jgi:hypothetical protein